MTITLHRDDLPDDITFAGSVAIDTETQGLNPLRDRLCLVQLSSGDGTAHLVQIGKQSTPGPKLKQLCVDPGIQKIFHFARFDVAVLSNYLGINISNVYCTKIASKLVRTYTDRHGLKDLCSELLSIELSKQQQSSDWAADTLSNSQQKYAASDVLYLHDLKSKLDAMLERENRVELAQACFDFLPTRAALDLKGWDDMDIFAH
ncbi:MAG: ribonuclease D [Methyloligellaceae bacterium]